MQILSIIEITAIIMAILLIIDHRRLLKKQAGFTEEARKATEIISRQEYLNNILGLLTDAKSFVYSYISGSKESSKNTDVGRILSQIASATSRGVDVRYILPKAPDRLRIGYENESRNAKVRYHLAPITDDLRFTIADDKKCIIGSPPQVSSENPTREGFFIESERLSQNLKELFERSWSDADNYEDYAAEEIDKHPADSPPGRLSGYLGVPEEEIERVKKKIAEKVKAVFFFDMDETVLDTGKIYFDARDAFVKELAHSVKVEDLNEEREKFWEFYGKTYLEARERGRHVRLYEAMTMYAESRGVDVNKSEELGKIGKEVYRKKFPLKPRAEKVIRSLNKDGCAVFLYTEGDINKMTGEQRNLFKKTYVISPKTISKMKSTFYKALDKVNVKDKNIYLVGDDPSTDIKAGNELGFTTIRFLSDVFIYPETKEDAKPDFAIKNLRELSSIVSY